MRNFQSMSPNNSDRLVSRRKFLVSSGAVSGIALAGCTSNSNVGGGSNNGSGSNGGNNTGGGGGGDGSQQLSGNIRISGSSTVYPIAQEMSRQFQQDHSDVSFNLTRDGSSGGFKNVFLPGDSDINNSSRPIESSEVKQARQNGFEPVEFYIAQDALTVVVNNQNDWVNSMSVETLSQIWSPGSAPTTWSDVNSDWPDEPFDLYGPATTSGTFDYFTEAVVGEEGKIRNDFEGTEQDDQIAQGVQGNKYAMGYLPFAYYTNNPDSTKALSLSSGGGKPVKPSLQSAQSGNYPLARPLFFYANMEKLQSKKHLQEFIRFYIKTSSNQKLIANQIGYVPSTKEMVKENLNTLKEAIAGDYRYSKNSEGSSTQSDNSRNTTQTSSTDSTTVTENRIAVNSHLTQ